jgi:polar amino acid transport system substrate-binding protein
MTGKGKIRMKKSKAFLGVPLLFLLMNALAAETLQVVTEEYPPYNYLKDGKVEGVGTEVVEEVLQEAGMNYRISVWPWARALRMAETEPNVLIYCISRTPKRESLYTWIGVIAPIRFYIYALSRRDEIPELSELEQARKYRVATVNQDALDQYLTEQNFPYIDKANTNDANLKRLVMGRVDLWPMSEYTANYLLKMNGQDAAILKKVFELKGFAGGDQYMAVSNLTDKSIVEKLQSALQKIKEDGRYQKILSKYE